jgi:hypothetical protein
VTVLIGGAARLEPDLGARLLPFVHALLEAARAARAVVIDGGTDAGVMALAGQARAELGRQPTDLAPLPVLLGIAPRGRVDAPDVPGPGGNGSTPLEMRHSHHLLVPGDEWGAETPWLIEVARLLSGGRPVVAVLLDGGPVALAEAMACAAQGWPIVTVAGSGRSADVLAGYEAAGAPEGGRAVADRRRIHVCSLSDGTAPLAATLARLLAGHPAAPTTDDAGDRLAASDYPALYVAASEAAKRGQRIHKLLSLGEILLTSAGLSVALIASVVFGAGEQLQRISAGLVTALAFLAALVLKLINRSSGYDLDWYNGRALAETVKSLSWRYMARAAPYRDDGADRRFRTDLALLLRRRPSFRQAIDRLPARAQQISAQMRAQRGLDLVGRRDAYVRWRILEQAEWYREKGASFGRWAARWYWLSVLSQLAGAALAILTLQTITLPQAPDLLRFIALFGAIALAMTAWSQLNRYDELARSYAVALQELLLIAAAGETVGAEEELDELVQEAEEATGREHRLWVAKRREPDVEQEGGDDELDVAERDASPGAEAGEPA